MKGMPTVRLEIEALGERIQGALMLHAEQISEEVMRGVKDATDALDVAALAREAAKIAIQDSVTRAVAGYFKYGDGHKVIEKVIGEAVARHG